MSFFLLTLKWIYLYDVSVSSLPEISFLNGLELICLHSRIAIISTCYVIAEGFFFYIIIFRFIYLIFRFS